MRVNWLITGNIENVNRLLLFRTHESIADRLHKIDVMSFAVEQFLKGPARILFDEFDLKIFGTTMLDHVLRPSRKRVGLEELFVPGPPGLERA